MALSNAERQRLYMARLKERAGDPPPRRTRANKTVAALGKQRGRAAWLKVRQERRAYRDAALAWRQRLDNILRAAAGVSAPERADRIANEAWELFHIRWKP
jgi:hypothetical protein